MKAMIYNGLFAPHSSFQVVPNCPTGNCTFPFFTSLAFCNKCENATNLVHLTQVTKNGGSDGPAAADEARTYTYSPQGNVRIAFTGYDKTNSTPGLITLVEDPAMLSQVDMPGSKSQAPLGILNTITSMAILQFHR